MSTEERLEELRAQRRLIENHLHWLDREIERELAGDERRTDEAPRQSAPPPAGTGHPPAEPAISVPAETPSADLPELPEVDHKAVKSEVRRGCLIYLAVFSALALIGGIVLYLIYGL